tara:strand:+ start:5266 stop:5778 length:513 start_codon:yes stop_codon:yes gene_type:complete
MSLASRCAKIKTRSKANDVFITPLELAKKHIDMIDFKEGDLVLDPCKNDGSYYNQFPENVEKDYCEILEDKDFFSYEGEPDIIIQNPPYSMLTNWFQKNLDLKPRIFSMLIGIHNLTLKRWRMCREAGYGITKFKLLKVKEWFGLSLIVVFEKDKEDIIEYDDTLFSGKK